MKCTLYIHVARIIHGYISTIIYEQGVKISGEQALTNSAMVSSSFPAEIIHPARLGCMLRLHVVEHPTGDAAAVAFQCDGCMLPGEGTRYTSVVDNHPTHLALHTSCALATPTLQHALVKGTMELRHEAPAGGAGVCSACFETVRGFHYYGSRKTGKGEHPKLHPCCARLPVSIAVRGGLTFELRAEVSHRCTGCRAMEWYYRPWCYRSTNSPDHRVYLHVKCIREIMESPGGGGGGGAGDEDDRVVARLLERADQSSKLERRVCKILVILVRVVVRMLIGDPTALLTEGVSAIVSPW